MLTVSYELPTEAQWEHTCRAGTDTALYTGSIEFPGTNKAPALDPIAWYGGNSGMDFELEDGIDTSDWPEMQYPGGRVGTHPVKIKQPNPWGLYDMLGNVREWCADGLRDYGEDDAIDPVGPDPQDVGAAPVIRSGSWRDTAWFCRSAYRGWFQPAYQGSNLGFRCARAQGPWA